MNTEHLMRCPFHQTEAIARVLNSELTWSGERHGVSHALCWCGQSKNLGSQSCSGSGRWLSDDDNRSILMAHFCTMTLGVVPGNSA